MTDTITLTGLIATDPRVITTSEGLPITSFRLASTQRRYDRAKQSWVDGETNWYTVAAFRRLASNAGLSLQKGQRVVVTGRLRLREWNNGDRAGLAVEVEAEAIGHDLTWGTATFSRNSVGSAASDLDADSSAPEASTGSAPSVEGTVERTTDVEGAGALVGAVVAGGSEPETPF